MKDSELAIIESGQFFIWSEPNSPAELYSDPVMVGHERAPLIPPGRASCGAVNHLGPEGYAAFTPITDEVQTLVIHALFELRRS